MKPEEITELIDLKGWSRVRLASELDVGENTVHQWISGRRRPGGPASILMKIWLAEARRGEKVAAS